MAVEPVSLFDRAPATGVPEAIAVTLDGVLLAFGQHSQDVAAFRLRDTVRFGLDQRHQFLAHGRKVKRWRRRHGENVWNTARSGYEVAPDLDLELGEFIDDEEVDLVGGEPPARNEATRANDAKHEVAAHPPFLTRFEGKNMPAREQLFGPLLGQIIGHHQRDVKRSRALCREGAHEHDRLN